MPVAVVFSDGSLKVTSDRCAAKEKLYLGAREQGDVMNEVGSFPEFTCGEAVGVDI